MTPNKECCSLCKKVEIANCLCGVGNKHKARIKTCTNPSCECHTKESKKAVENTFAKLFGGQVWPEKPQESDWAEEFDKYYAWVLTCESKSARLKALKDFISSLLKYEREKAYEKAEKDILRRSGGVEAVGKRAYRAALDEVKVLIENYIQTYPKDHSLRALLQVLEQKRVENE